MVSQLLKALSGQLRNQECVKAEFVFSASVHELQQLMSDFNVEGVRCLKEHPV
jgi:hypothetical protein